MCLKAATEATIALHADENVTEATLYSLGDTQHGNPGNARAFSVLHCREHQPYRASCYSRGCSVVGMKNAIERASCMQNVSANQLTSYYHGIANQLHHHRCSALSSAIVVPLSSPTKGVWLGLCNCSCGPQSNLCALKSSKLYTA